MSRVRWRWAGLAIAALAVWGLLRISGVLGDADEAAQGRTQSSSPLGSGGVPGLEGVGGRRADSAIAPARRGVVVDEDGAPVRGGAVRLSCLVGNEASAMPDAARDEEGAFAAPGCRGVVCASLQHASLVQTGPWELEGGGVASLVAGVRPQWHGQVLAPDRSPVANAAVIVAGVGEGVAASSVRTDAEGAFSLPRTEPLPCDRCRAAQGRCDPEAAPAGRGSPRAEPLRLTATATGHAATTHLLDPTHPPDAPIVLVLAARADPIVGTLLSPTGDPYPGAFVLARGRGAPADQHRAEAGDGSFALEDLSDGESYDLRAIQDGVLLWRSDGPVSPGDTLEVRLAATPASGTVAADARAVP